MRRGRIILWISAVAAAWLLLDAGTARADEAPAARACFEAMDDALRQLQRDLPRYARAAGLAAERYLRGATLGVRGNAQVARDLGSRPGGLADYRGGPGDDDGIVLYLLPDLSEQAAPRHAALKALDELTLLRERGATVIVLGSVARLRALRLVDRFEAVSGALLDDHAIADAPHQSMALAGSWAFTAELFAACTRRGRTPVLRESFDIDTRHRRFYRYVGQRFHHDRRVEPMEPGALGAAYVEALSTVLRDVGTAEWPELTAAARRAASVHRRGHRIWVRSGDLSLDHRLLQHFEALDHDGSDPALPRPGPHDLVLAFGAAARPGDLSWGEPELLRQAGQGVVWIVSGHYLRPQDLRRHELLIQTWIPFGDAAVKIEQYDSRFGAVSGIVHTTILHALAAQVR